MRALVKLKRPAVSRSQRFVSTPQWLALAAAAAAGSGLMFDEGLVAGELGALVKVGGAGPERRLNQPPRRSGRSLAWQQRVAPPALSLSSDLAVKRFQHGRLRL
ncbi:unnamed protein product [Boreogadus saida]